ncbi:acylneuraminate cytidylyltransferase family protein [Sphingomonas sp. SRS2]|uniref:acylneuraminate cytidylyltransferase family protein n=1 Tax=Sphingomonas sp. SRS2 TaxID=133190 RepID=UPI000618470A|nr:acylneuraminate cytidylyltransferase family protein [Sphingomonas sp. SRS2]KKC24368.1 hypothetical protein WP12_19620 [Sphingomonas sp. SRS2]
MTAGRISDPWTGPPRVLAVVPARAGSKGIVGKNIRLLNGIPLLAHAIGCARRTKLIDRVILTTDSEEIADIGRRFGAEVPFLRPAALAADETPMLDVLDHAIHAVADAGWAPDLIVLLQPTAPFRRDQDVEAAIRMLGDDPQADSVVSVERIPAHFAPQWAMKVVDGALTPVIEGAIAPRRQDIPPAYTRNGQFYVTRWATLVEGRSVYGNRCLAYETVHRAVNLDSPEDWEEAVRLAEDVGLPLS